MAWLTDGAAMPLALTKITYDSPIIAYVQKMLINPLALP